MKKICVVFVLCCSLLSASLLFAAGMADEKEVVVLGIGTTETEAKQQAYRSAIQSVIGSMVISQTIVENEALVQDKILSHSDGYIVKAAQIGPTRQLAGNLLEVSMRVTVKSKQLKEKLQAENITVVSLDGQSLFAQSTTKDDTAKDAAGIIKAKLEGVPASVLTAEADVKSSKQTNLEDGLVALTLPVKLSVDRGAYRNFVADMKKTLQQLGYKGKAMQLSLNISDKFKPYDSHVSLSEFIDTYANKIPNDDTPKHGVIIVGEGIQASSNTLRATGYYVPKKAALAFHHEKTFILAVELLDASGSVIMEQTWGNSEISREQWLKFNKANGSISLRAYASGSIVRTTNPQREDKSGRFGGVAYVLPSPFISPIDSYTPFYAGTAATLPITFELSAEELQKVTSVKCTVRNFE